MSDAHLAEIVINANLDFRVAAGDVLGKEGDHRLLRWGSGLTVLGCAIGAAAEHGRVGRGQVALVRLAGGKQREDVDGHETLWHRKARQCLAQ